VTRRPQERILVVDDEQGIRAGCRRVLEEEGYQVIEAEDGSSGLAKAKAESCDLLLVDMMMPGISGLDLIAQVHEFDPEIILIVITGYATIESTVDAMKRGAFDYIPKPFSPEALVNVVQRGLEMRSLRLEAKALREERRHSLLALASEQSQTRTILSCMAEGIIVTNHEGRLVLWNNTAANMLKMTGTDTADQPLTHYTGNGPLIELLTEVSSTESNGFNMIRREITGDDDSLAIMASIAPVLDEQGEKLGAVTVLSDISELKEIDKVKSQFVSMVAHELRAPLAAIEGWLDVVLSGAAGNDEAQTRKWLGRAKGRAHSLLELVNDLLVFNRMDAGRVAQDLEPLDLNELISATTEFLSQRAAEAEVTLELKLPADLSPVLADKNDMERLFTNLIDNGIKYNKAGGNVTITAEEVDGVVRIAVTDTGIGIAEDDLPRLCEDFFRVENKFTKKIHGTGLGLAIATKIVTSHNGRLDIESRLGEGSTFTVSLPRAES
jgi:two-component system, OmpR family, phosphate regulon sensor histidine kinase PhoR